MAATIDRSMSLRNEDESSKSYDQQVIIGKFKQEKPGNIEKPDIAGLNYITYKT